MDNADATAYLASLLNRTLHVHTRDERVFVGQFRCTDKDRNLILALTNEKRLRPARRDARPGILESAAGADPAGEARAAGPEAEAVEREGGGGEEVEEVEGEWMTRYVGLVVVPGDAIVKIEVQEPVGGTPGAGARLWE